MSKSPRFVASPLYPAPVVASWGGSISMQPPIYCVVTPVRNEEEYLPITIAAVAAQTMLPVEWIIVNDGSTDRTAEIIDDAAAKYPWIRAFHRTNRGFRSTGG